MSATTDVFGAVFISFVGDLKSSSPAWETVCSRAVKLSTQLNSLAGCLSSFIEAMQVISDNANNVKGASRDIGASLTRFCLRQKSLEKLIRGLASALNDCFVSSLEKKMSEWRQHVSEIERRRNRNLKKWKQKSPEAYSETQNCYSELLMEQRKQFIYFVNALLPIMDAEIKILDEGSHVRQVRDSMTETANGSDSQCMIENIIEDAQLNCNNFLTGKIGSANAASDETLWQRRMSSCGNTTLSKSSNQNIMDLKKQPYDVAQIKNLPINSSPCSISSSGFSQSFHDSYMGSNSGDRKISGSGLDSDISGFPSRPHTITSARNGEVRRASISAQTFMPPLALQTSVESEVKSSTSSSLMNSPMPKPPLPIRYQQQPKAVNDMVYSVPLYGNSLSMSASDLPETVRRNSRPLSLSGCDLPNDGIYQYFQPDNANMRENGEDGRCSTLLIAETLHQIDQLGVELDSYCRTLKPVIGSSIGGTAENLSSGVSSSNVSLENNISQQQQRQQLSESGAYATLINQKKISNGNNNSTVRYRPDNIRPPPPLPERRNSTITAATPTAPSIVDIRSSTGNQIFYQAQPIQQYSRPPSQASSRTWMPNNIINSSDTTIQQVTGFQQKSEIQMQHGNQNLLNNLPGYQNYY